MTAYTCTFTDKAAFSWSPSIPSSLNKGDTLNLAGPSNFSSLSFTCSRANGAGTVSSLSCNGASATYDPTSATKISCDLKAKFTCPGTPGGGFPEYNMTVATLTLDNP